MSLQVKKKFIRSQVIDGSKVLFLNEDAFKALNASGSEVSLFKLDSQNKLQFLQMPKVSSDPVATEDLSRKGYVDSKVSAEQTRAEAAEGALDGRLDTIEAVVTPSSVTLTGSGPATITASDLEFAVSGTIDFGGKVLNSVGDGVAADDAATKGQVDAEATARASADSALDARLDIIEGADTVAGSVAKALKDAKAYTDAEQSRAEGAESALDARLDIIEGADTVAGSVAKALKDAKAYTDAEQARAEGAESALSGRLDALESDPVTKSYVDAADDNLLSAIQAEESARISAISSEQTARESADASLSGEIQGERERIDAILLASDADKDSFAEIVQLINSVDTENDSAFAAYVLSNDAALAQEISDREAAVSAEQSRAEGAEVALSGRLDVLEADPVTLTYVDEQIALVSDGFDSALSQEISDRQAADALLLPLAGGTMAGDIAMDGHDLLGAGKLAAQYIEVDSATASSIISGTSVTLDAPVVYIANSGSPGTIETNGGAVSAASVTGALFELSDDVGLSFSGANGQVTLPNGSVLSEVGLSFATAGSIILFTSMDGVIDGLAAPSGDLMAANKGYVDAAIAQEVSDRDAAIGVETSLLSGRLDALEADPVTKSYVDTEVQGAKDYADQKVADLVNSAPAVLDTLKELADALGSDPNFATTVAGQIGDEAARAESAESALDARITSLENNSAYEFIQERFVLSSGNITAGYIELAHEAVAASINAYVDRMGLHETDDYTISVVGGKTRLTWAGSVMVGGEEELSAGDIVRVKYAFRNA